MQLLYLKGIEKDGKKPHAIVTVTDISYFLYISTL